MAVSIGAYFAKRDTDAKPLREQKCALFSFRQVVLKIKYNTLICKRVARVAGAPKRSEVDVIRWTCNAYSCFPLSLNVKIPS